MRRRHHGGFTLIELLVVIGILSILGGFLLSAVQSAREAARLNSCRSNLSQLSKGLIQHELLLRHFPSGGWGPEWLGVAERSGDSAQPGGWAFSVLPYIEEKDLRDAVEGVTSATAKAAYEKLVTAAIPGFACPTRRTAQPRSVTASNGTLTGAGDVTVTVAQGTRSDYATNSGANGPCIDMSAFKAVLSGLTGSSYNGKKITVCHKGKSQSIALPALNSVGHADDRIGGCANDAACNQPFGTNNRRKFMALSSGDSWRKLSAKDKILADVNDMGVPDAQDGIVFRMSRIQAGSVFDGLSNTYLLAEKSVVAGSYQSGTDDGDARPMMVGYAQDNVRWAFVPPARDSRTSNPAAFGSGHAGGWNVAYADGMVRTTSFSIDAELHKKLARRNNGPDDTGLIAMPPKD
jgi:prepilin-type N-terminal cleavage/methylation domain-containing protein